MRTKLRAPAAIPVVDRETGRRVCVWCGKALAEGRSRMARFCDHACRNRYHEERRAIARATMSPVGSLELRAQGIPRRGEHQ